MKKKKEFDKPLFIWVTIVLVLLLLIFIVELIK